MIASVPLTQYGCFIRGFDSALRGLQNAHTPHFALGPGHRVENSAYNMFSTNHYNACTRAPLVELSFHININGV